MKKLRLLTEEQFETHKPHCVFEYYDRKWRRLYECGKPAVFRYGTKFSDGMCEECADILSSRGVLTVGPDGMEYSSSKEALKAHREAISRG